MRKFARVMILLTAAALAVFLAWDYLGQEKTVYTEVLVLQRKADAGTVITADLLETKSLPLAGENSLRPEDARELLGKECVRQIAAGAELRWDYFEDPRLLVHPEKGEILLPVSISWLITDPLGLARGDEAVFFAEDGREILHCTVVQTAQRSEAGQTVTVFEYEAGGKKHTETYDSYCPVSVIVTEEQMQQLLKMAGSGQKFLLAGR